MIWTIRKKLLIAFMAGALLMLGIGAFSLYKMSTLNADTVEIGTNWMPSILVEPIK